MKEVSVMDYVRVLRKRLILILLIPILAMGLSYYYFDRNSTPIYESKSMVAVGKRAGNETGRELYYGQLANRDLAVTYVNLAKSNIIAEKVAAQMPVKTSASAILSSLQVNQIPGTQLMTLKVQNPDPKWAAQVNSLLTTAIIQRLNEIEMSEVATLVDPVVTPTSPIPTNHITKVLLVGIMGFLFSVVLAFLIEFATRVRK
jgi:capsular polysaccharide biosynthesis protein